ncbi:MAG: HAD family phosphatase, partial [Chloroflexi bacterium]|nr:HAD family phosphatase [Chloroflexota bacterium]
SCFAHIRKPDTDLSRLALDVAQAAPQESAYIEDRAMFVEVAETLGIQGIYHTDYETTRKALAVLGLSE